MRWKKKTESCKIPRFVHRASYELRVMSSVPRSTLPSTEQGAETSDSGMRILGAQASSR